MNKVTMKGKVKYADNHIINITNNIKTLKVSLENRRMDLSLFHNKRVKVTIETIEDI